MHKVLGLVAISALFSTLALAENWSGRLLDSTCYDQQKKVDSCDATSRTTAFALSASGGVFKLDAAGNAKAATALKSRADRSTDPTKAQSKEVMAKVEGTQKAGVIMVESIDIE